MSVLSHWAVSCFDEHIVYVINCHYLSCTKDWNKYSLEKLFSLPSPCHNDRSLIFCLKLTNSRQ